MNGRFLEVRITRRHDTDGSSCTIHLRDQGGSWQSFSSIQDAPPEWRPLIKRLLKEDVPPLPASEPIQKRQRHSRPAELTLPWFDPLAAFGGFALASWMLWTQRAVLTGRQPWTGWTVAALLLAVVGGYLGLAFLINRTTFEVAEDMLKVHHGPFPWSGARDIQREDLVQLYVRVHSRSKGIDYSLWALTKTGSVRLTGCFGRPEELRRIEKEIEERYGIVDVPVRGSQYR